MQSVWDYQRGMNLMNKGFTLTSRNGSKLSISKSIINTKQKSYDVLVNNGKDNIWYKVGIIRDIDKLNEVFN